MDTLDRFLGCLLGLAVGDAVGTTVEFLPRGTFTPVTDMIGQGPFHLKAGEWTDDTSMALCLATSLLEKNGFDARDQMERYWQWYQNGYLSSNGHCFDIGNTVRGALERYRATGDPFSGSTSRNTAGNGSIMRLAPVALFYFPDRAATLRYAAESSRTTHGTTECLEACRLLGDILWRALSGADKFTTLCDSKQEMFSSPSLAGIARGDYRTKPKTEIRGAGYVVNSLEAALWSFWSTENFRQAILSATNLGDDADTTAAICGQVAGAYYGVAEIPQQWLERLVMRQEISTLAERLYSEQSVS
jgi:ADP-ribosyl-[dinitrogen reductase] hydrolase